MTNVHPKIKNTLKNFQNSRNLGPKWQIIGVLPFFHLNNSKWPETHFGNFFAILGGKRKTKFFAKGALEWILESVFFFSLHLGVVRGRCDICHTFFSLKFFTVGEGGQK